MYRRRRSYGHRCADGKSTIICGKKNRLVARAKSHDENAFADWRVSGHAGFPYGADWRGFLARCFLLNAAFTAHQDFFGARRLHIPLTRSSVPGTADAAIGWAVPTEGGSSGHYFSAQSFWADRILPYFDLDRIRTAAFQVL